MLCLLVEEELLRMLQCIPGSLYPKLRCSDPAAKYKPLLQNTKSLKCDAFVILFKDGR